MRKVLSLGLIFVLIFSGLVIFGSHNVSAANPTLTAYRCTPTTFDMGQQPDFYMYVWCTYTDADNDSPTTLNVNRYITPTYLIVKAMTANDSGDTNYADGKLYYCTLAYYEWPFLGAQQLRITYASNGSATYNKLVAFVTQIPIGVFFQNYGLSPANQTTPDNYTFFTEYRSSWGYVPEYVKLCLDDVLYTMTKNDSGDSYPNDGINYTLSLNLTAGFHKYSFNTSLAAFPSDRYIGDFYILISEEKAFRVSFGVIAMIALLGASMVMVVWGFKK
jgi:hypothetical protein